MGTTAQASSDTQLGLFRSLPTIALFGTTAIIAQVLLLRECLVVVAGNELFIALFFGCWFIGITLGAAIGSLRGVGDRWLVRLVPAFLTLQVLLLPLLIISLRWVRARWGLPAYQLVPFWPLLRMAAEHLCPFSLLTGLTFPMLCRLVATSEAESAMRAGRRRAIGLVYAVESLGSLAGGAVATFVFAAYCEPLTAAWILGALTTANLAWFLAGRGDRAARISAVAAATLAVGFVAIAVSPLRTAIAQWSAGLRHRAYDSGFEWLAERYTPYQHLAVARLALFEQEYQYSLLSNGQFVETYPNPLVVRQHVHLMMSQCEKPRRVLLVGGGASGALRFLLLYPQLEIDYVEIDPQVIAVLRPFLAEEDRRALDDPRVHIFHEDARRFMRRQLEETASTSGARYDAIICSTPDPSTAALNRFYTSNFFAEARRLLGDSGVFVTAITSSANYFDEDVIVYVGSVYEALVRTFGHVLATPDARAVFFAAARDDLLTSDVGRLIERFERRAVADPEFSPLYFHTPYERNHLRRLNETLRGTLGKVRPNSDLEPVTYLYYLRLWNRFSGEKSQRFLALIEKFNWQWVVAVCAAALIVRFATRRRWTMTSDRAAFRHAAAVLFVTGVAGMVSSIVLLLLFQNLHGSLYRDVGLLVASFMAGLTLGSFAGNRIGLDDKRALHQVLAAAVAAYGCFFVILGVLVGFGALGQLSARLLGHSSFFYIATVLAGLLTGMPFALVGRLGVVCGRDPGSTGGVLESLDHLGACLGAFATGIVLVPVSGVFTTLGLFALVEFAAATSLALVAIMLRRSRQERV